MEISLRGAIIISAIIHASIFAPLYNQQLVRQELAKKNSVVVDYVILKDIARSITMNKEIALKIPETPSIDIKKDVELRPQPKQARQLKAESKKRIEARKLKDNSASKKADAVKAAAAQEQARKEARLKSSKDYVNYYQLIREKIRARLKDGYRNYSREGDVYLSFTLTPNGSLLSYSIDLDRSTSDEMLLDITAASLKAVSPFPALPRAFSAQKMSFNIAISFKK